MSDRTLKKLIANLRAAISDSGLTERAVDDAIAELAKIRRYDEQKFPALPDMKFEDTIGATPRSLAEALLWKLGKWTVYKRFAANYQTDNPSPTRTDVVLFAFAKHLKDKSIPIYDQHAIRALWAIDEAMVNEAPKLKSLLFNGRNIWKATGSGGDTIECYELFVDRVPKVLSKIDAPSLNKMDRLLMPLGQSIKRATGSYEEFCELCGRPSEG